MTGKFKAVCFIIITAVIIIGINPAVFANAGRQLCSSCCFQSNITIADNSWSIAKNSCGLKNKI